MKVSYPSSSPAAATPPPGGRALRWCVRMSLAAGVLIAAAASPAQAQIDIAVTRLTVDPATPVAGQRATLTATLQSRQLAPSGRRLETVNVRVLFTRTVERQRQQALEVAVGQQR